jgi:serine/threonine protein kinase
MTTAQELCPRCGTTLCDTTAGPAVCPRCELAAALGEAADLPFSGRLGNYELESLIAHGGMGAVYRAYHRDTGQTVALKTLLAGRLASAEIRERFLREARLAAQLRHPHIVPLLEVGEADGLPYIAMEFVLGKNLADLVRDGPLAPSQAASLLAKAAQAVAYAHQQGILHRDIKPANILLDAAGEPRVADFGLARLIEAGATELTATGQVLGSPGYLAPERVPQNSRPVARNGDTVGMASDVYSLGATLYHLLTGRPPFQGATLDAVLMQVVKTEPIAVRKLNPSVPTPLETVCLKCLEKEPRRRYASAQELADELERFLKGELIRARPVTPAGHFCRWVGRHRAVSSLSAILLLSLLSGGITVWRTNRQLRLSLLAEKKSRATEVENLRGSLVAQARVVRQSDRIGQRLEALAILERAAKLKLTPEIRDEAAAALANFDLREISRHPLPPMPSTSYRALTLDATLEAMVCDDPKGGWQWRALDGSRSSRPIPDSTQTDTLAFHLSPDGRWFVVQVQGELQLWRTDGREPQQRWPVHERYVAGSHLMAPIGFRGDSSALAVAREDGSVEILTLGAGARRTVVPHGAPVIALAFDPAGTRLAVVRPETVEIRALDTHHDPIAISLSDAAPRCAWSSDGKLLAVGSAAKHSIEIKLAGSGETLTTLNLSAQVSRFAFQPGGRLFAAVTSDDLLSFWELPDTRPVLSLQANGRVLQFSADGRRLASATVFNELAIYEVAPSRVFRGLQSSDEAAPLHAYSMDTSADGRLIVTSDAVGLRFWDARAGREILDLPEPSSYWTSVLLLPDSQSVVYCVVKQGVIRRTLAWRNSPAGAQTLEVGPRLSAGGTQNDYIFGVTRKGNWVVAGLDSLGGFYLWPRGDAERRRKFAEHRSLNRAVVPNLSTDEKYAALYISPGEIEIWSVADARFIRSLPGGPFNAAIFTPDDRWLVTGTEHEVQLWEPGNWRLVRTVAKGLNRENFADLFFSHDGKLMIFQASAERFQIRSMPDFGEVFSLEAPYSLARRYTEWSQDATRLYLLGENNRPYEWDLAALRDELAKRNFLPATPH